MDVSKDYQYPLLFLGPAPQTSTTTKDNLVIGDGDESGDDLTNRQMFCQLNPWRTSVSSSTTYYSNESTYRGIKKSFVELRQYSS